MIYKFCYTLKKKMCCITESESAPFRPLVFKKGAISLVSCVLYHKNRKSAFTIVGEQLALGASESLALLLYKLNYIVLNWIHHISSLSTY